MINRECKFRHITIEKNGKIELLLGVDKNCTDKEILNYMGPIGFLPADYFDLKKEDKIVIKELINDLETKYKAKVKLHNWAVVVDFIYFAFGKTLNDVGKAFKHAAKLSQKKAKVDNDIAYNEIYETLRLLEVEDKKESALEAKNMRNAMYRIDPSRVKDLEKAKGLMGLICRYFFITEDILSTGEGMKVFVKPSEYESIRSQENMDRRIKLYDDNYNYELISNSKSIKDNLESEVRVAWTEEFPVRIMNTGYSLDEESMEIVRKKVKEIKATY